MCPYCGEDLKPQAAICPHCGRSIPRGAIAIEKVGPRHVLGRLEDEYGIWEYASGGEPVARFPKSEEGWRHAWSAFEQFNGGAQPGGGTNGVAVAGLVLGVIGAVVGLIPLLSGLALICGILGVVFGVIGIRRAARVGGRGMAIAGLVLGIIAIILAIIGFVILEDAAREIDRIFEEFP